MTAGERAALAYADLLATDHLAIDDAVFARLREHFSDAQIMELCFDVGSFVGRIADRVEIGSAYVHAAPGSAPIARRATSVRWPGEAVAAYSIA